MRVVSCVVYHYICCLKVRWVPRFDQSFGIYTGVKNSFAGIAGVSPLTIISAVSLGTPENSAI